MTARDVDLLAALAEVVGADHLAVVRSWRRSYDPVADLDEDSLRRMRHGLSRHARSVERRPVSQAVDELGYAPSGVWVPESDEWRRSA